MRKQIPNQLEQGRLTGVAGLETNPSDRHGAFVVLGPQGQEIRIISSGTEDPSWEHVSVTVAFPRCPTWEEMQFVKELFWNDDECVVQFHPPRQDYVNNHPFCLHLWKPVGHNIPTPPKWMIA